MDRPNPQPGQTYKHYKGNLYKVLCVALHTETEEPFVVYECLYENETSQYWVRPLAMFMETVEKDGATIPRFELVSE